MKFRFIILFSLLFFCGCVKNIITIHIRPTGSFDMNITAIGNKEDILDDDFPIPINNGWTIESDTYNNEDDTYEISVSKYFKPNEKISENFHVNSNKKNHPFLKHNIDVKYRNRFFYKTYELNIIFKSRMVDEKYPQFINVINNPEENYPGWATEVFSYLFTETINRSKIEFNQKGMVQRDINTWIQKNIASKNDSMIIELFPDLKEQGLDMLMHPLNPNLYNDIDSIFNYLEKEYEITQLLVDDDFEIQLSLPGELIQSNHTNIKGDTLIWNFSLNKFMNQDFKISASTQINYKNRLILAIILILIVGIGLLIRKIS